MSGADREKKLEALERWARSVEVDGLVVVDTSALRKLLQLAEQRTAVEAELVEAVCQARADNYSWSEIGTMLGVSKQAAQRRYGRATSAA